MGEVTVLEDKMGTTNKSSGPDNIHPNVLQEYSTSLSYPLTILFRKSIALGNVPASLKEANVTAIFKKGNNNFHQTTGQCL